MSQFALFHSPNHHDCAEFHLVLQSMQIESDVVLYEGRHYLLVDEQVARYAYSQLKLYVQENAPETVISRPLVPLSRGFVGAYLYTIMLLVVGMLKNTSAFGFDWHHSGLAHAGKIVAGEWWRSITALTLHADVAHMTGNIGFGVLFGLLVSQYIGSGAAWLSIVLAGALGNSLNALLHQGLHQSIGASTMVFAALGMLGVFALKAHGNYRYRGVRRWVPLISTLALLAFVGTGGERTDLFAHLWGYICGGAVGLVWLGFGSTQDYAANSKLQLRLGLASFGAIVLAWTIALV